MQKKPLSSIGFLKNHRFLKTLNQLQKDLIGAQRSFGLQGARQDVLHLGLAARFACLVAVNSQTAGSAKGDAPAGARSLQAFECPESQDPAALLSGAKG